MSGWEVGDLALCVDANPHPHSHTRSLPPLIGLELGKVYTVTGVVAAGLLLADVPQIETPEWLPAFRAWRFRKIKPDQHEDCEPEFVALLNRSKRKVEA